MNASIIQKFFVDGPAGRLETILAEPKSKPCGIAIIAHPHPLYGGTMDNKVVYTLFNTLLELDLITVKFNFRGVGNSEGIYDNGIGEVDDVVTITWTICNQFNNQLTYIYPYYSLDFHSVVPFRHMPHNTLTHNTSYWSHLLLPISTHPLSIIRPGIS